MSIEDEFQKMLGAKAAASDQLDSEMQNLAIMLGQFRSYLVLNGFTTSGAEDHTLEWFNRLLMGQPSDEED